jgi:hypothetical protein
LVEADASDFAIASILSQKFEDGKFHLVSFISRKLLRAELNYDVYEKEMLAIVFPFRKWRHCLQGVKHKIIVYSDHQNQTYFKSAVSRNRRQVRWAEDLETFNFDLFYHKCSANQNRDTLSTYPTFTSTEVGTRVAGNLTMSRKQQQMEVVAMEIEKAILDNITIAARDIEQLLPKAKEHIKEKAMLDVYYRTICKHVSLGGNVDKEYTVRQNIVFRKNRIQVPDGIQKMVRRWQVTFDQDEL